jgi:acyl-[acyl-carrier-protein] desaturase
MGAGRLPKTKVDLLEELTPDVERLFNRHLESPRDWFPHEIIDWGQGQSYNEQPWSPEDYDIAPGVRSSIYVNLLTEDNLPYYTNSILRHGDPNHPINEWTHQWTMEENRHSMVMRDWVHISRCIDPTLLEEGRRVQMCKAEVPQHNKLADMIAYVAMQERATQIAHRNTAAKLPKEDKIGRNVLGTVAGDETKHYMFYRDLVLAAMKIDPSVMVESVRSQIVSFAMPGTGIPQFTRHAVRIAREGIYGLSQFAKDVLEPVLALWDIEHLTGLSEAGEKAREELVAVVATIKANVERAAQRLAGTPQTV